MWGCDALSQQWRERNSAVPGAGRHSLGYRRQCGGGGGCGIAGMAFSERPHH